MVGVWGHKTEVELWCTISVSVNIFEQAWAVVKVISSTTGSRRLKNDIDYYQCLNEYNPLVTPSTMICKQEYKYLTRNFRLNVQRRKPVFRSCQLHHPLLVSRLSRWRRSWSRTQFWSRKGIESCRWNSWNYSRRLNYKVSIILPIKTTKRVYTRCSVKQVNLFKS